MRHAPALLAVIVGVLVSADPVAAQTLSLDFGEGGSSSARIIQLIFFLAIITLAPSILIMVTSFVRIVVVLSFLRTAMGTQQTPPNVVLTSLALFMTFFIMQPTLEQAYQNGIQPLIDEEITEAQALDLTVAPFHAFMRRHVRPQDLELFMEIGQIAEVAAPEDTPLRALSYGRSWVMGRSGGAVC